MSLHCRTCNQSFLNDQGYELHKRDSASHDYCWHCDSDFDSPVLLEDHYAQSPRHAFCQYCKKHLQSRQVLENHWEDCHHWCASHRQIFANEVMLNTHMTIDHNHCAQCNLFFRSSVHLEAHFASRRHQPATVICPGDDCGCVFNKAADLIQHFQSGSCSSGTAKRIYDLDRLWKTIGRIAIIGVLIIVRLVHLIRFRRRSCSSFEGHVALCIPPFPRCNLFFQSFSHLEAHFASRRHQPALVICPGDDCGCIFNKAADLLQHVQSGSCSSGSSSPDLD
ncbi:hypothetical protein PENSPDRAFT_594854 [Peniophora sp. CONT]|nr:hypothetical protein PENSPDRAFT_594854 [Peniophora sp. CONT]